MRNRLVRRDYFVIQRDAGLYPPFDFRNRACGTCRGHLVKGSVAYSTLPTAALLASGESICCARPSSADDQ
jgi:ferredoxin